MVKKCIENVTFPLEIAGVPSGRAKQKHWNLLNLSVCRESAYPSELSGGQNKEWVLREH